MFRLLIISIFLTTSVFSVALERVEFSLGPWASPVLAELLGDAQNFSEVTAINYRKGTKVSEADCVAMAERPNQTEEASFSDSNQIVCSFTQDRERGVLILSLRDVPVSAWGTRLDRNHFQFEGPLVFTLARMIKSRLEKEPEHPILSYLDFMGFGGNQIVGYEIRKRPDVRRPDGNIEYSPLAVSCSFFATQGKLWKSFCAVLDL